MATAWKKYFCLPAPRTLIALTAGLLWASAFPLFDLSFAAWVAPGLLLFTGMGVTPGHAARLGYLAGAVHFFVSLYWLLHIPFPVGNIAAWISLSAFCALYPSLWMWLSWKTCPVRISARDNPADGPIQSGRFQLDRGTRATAQDLFAKPWLSRQLWIAFCAVNWTTLEFTRGWFLTGFPWNFLGASQYRSIPLIQISEFTGVMGVTFVVVWTSIAIILGALLVIVRPQIRFAWKNEIALALLVMLCVVSWGATKTMEPARASDRTMKLAMVQPSIPQTLIFDANESTNRFRQIMELSRRALETRPDVLVWPEASLPASLSQEYVDEISAMVIEYATPLILGKLDFDVFIENGKQRYQPFNAAIMLDGNARHVATYRKQRLVIFGEYTPFAKQFPFLAKIFPTGVGFGAGQTPEPFIVGDQHANVSVNICFEDNFADVVSDQTHPETDFVLNLTNNGWFSESAAQWQHAANAVFRAVENRVPLVRVTNNGLSCWIDEFGRLRDVFTDENGSVYGNGFQTIEVPLLNEGETRTATFYHVFGDWFSWACSGVTLLALGICVLRKRRTSGVKQAARWPNHSREVSLLTPVPSVSACSRHRSPPDC